MTELETTGVRVLRDLRPARTSSDEVGTQAIVDLAAHKLFGDAPPEPAPRPALGRYELRGRISYGGMGQVLRAWDPFLHREVAIKVCLPGHDAADRERLFNEARALSQLGHPHIVQLHHADEIDGQLCVVLELIDGPTLATWVDDTKPTWRAVYDVLLPVGDALAAVHAEGLLHRDIKPKNILLAPDGAKLIDFGLVTTIDPADEDGAVADLDEPGRLFGTRSFLAPELLLGEPATRQSDVFAFAVTFYWALYRANPFPAHTLRSGVLGTPGAALSAALTPSASTPEGVLGPYHEPTGPAPRWLARILRRALHPDRARRYPTIDALLADLRHRARVRPYTLRAGALLAAFSASYAIGVARSSDPAQSCEAHAAAAHWQDARAAVEVNLAAAAAPAVRAAAGPLTAELARYADALDKAQADLCQARVTRPPDDRVVAHRDDCLERARLAFDARLARGWDDLTDPADLALPDLHDCASDVIATQDCRAPVDDPAVPAIDASLARSLGARAIGDLPGAVAHAAEAARLADAAELPGLQARSHYALGEAHYEAGRYVEAIDELLLARDTSATQCDDIFVDALSRLNKIAARTGLIPDAVARDHLRSQVAAAALQDPMRHADARNDRALLELFHASPSDPAAARDDLLRAIKARKDLLTQAPTLRLTLAQAESYLNLGTALHSLHDDPGAAAALAQEAALRSAAVGAGHPSHYKRHLNQAQWATDAKRLDEAERELDAALPLARAYGERSHELAKVELELARVAWQRKDTEGALRWALAARATAADLPASNGAFDTTTGVAHILAQAEADANANAIKKAQDDGEPEPALTTLAEPRALLTHALTTYGGDTSDNPARIAELHARLASFADQAGDPTDTEAHARAAVQQFRRGGITVHPYLAIAESKLGRALAGLVVEEEDGPPPDRPRLLEARRAFDAALDLWARQPDHPDAPLELTYTYADRANVHCSLGDRDAAKSDRAEAERRAEKIRATADLEPDFEALKKRSC